MTVWFLVAGALLLCALAAAVRVDTAPTASAPERARVP
ncbi:hypothetical protein SAMN05443668_105433 [Cryptosporangium aurantiacum]|uniref:Uncharacterized protein n=1 Tax=Cryptosporangium aurantiacum TaxID=134849 RepID=A0A1M7QVW8_9ACTN|nr:hypothetical protein SAMN05443668_105433 [Cryptosporangium aurantiacum]